MQRAEKFSVRLPVVGRVAVPPPDQLAFGLGVLAGVGLVDWPVAVAIGVGQAVVARHFTDQHAGAEPSRPPEREIPAASPRRGAAQVHSAQVHCRQNVCEEGDGQQGGHIRPGVDITTSPRARHRQLYRRMTRRGITTIDRDSGPAALGPTRRVVAPEVIRVPVEPHRFGAADGTVSGGTQRVRFCIRPLRCVSASATAVV